MSIINENLYAVILAGGSGTRFWPKSRHLTPKQLCKIGSETKTMLEMTLNRLDGLVPPSRRIIVTHRDQIEKTTQIAGNRCRTFLAEPQAKNTANAIVLAALEIEKIHPSAQPAIMISVHADAIIKDTSLFTKALETAVEVSKEDFLTLLGIAPDYPETGYGYIERGPALSSHVNASLVKSFREKPNYKLAEDYVNQGHFFWNAGIFTWKISTILAEFQRLYPNILEILKPLLKHYDSFSKVPKTEMTASYERLPNLTIDNGILEQSQKVALVECSIGWQDVGAWDALEKCFPTDEDNNILAGDCLSIDCKNTTIDTDGPYVATLGLENMVVVAAKGAILVCPKDRSQEVKKIVSRLKQSGREELT